MPVLNVQAYLLGAIAFALSPWIAVAFTVTLVLLLTGREKLHALARRIAVKEIVTAGEFLILTGIILPLLPNEPVTTLTTITPHQAWLALVVVSSLSYVSYLAQRYWLPRPADYGWRRWRPLFVDGNDGGAGAGGEDRIGDAAACAGRHHARHRHHVSAHSGGRGVLQYDAGAGLGAAALRPFAGRPRNLRAAISVCKTGAAGRESAAPTLPPSGGNPLELGPAALFAFLFVAVSLVSKWAATQFGSAGIYSLAAIVGVTDIDPFVLNLAQGGTSGMSDSALAAAILIAASSNNILKAAYAAFFAGGRATAGSAAVLVLLAVAGVAIALTRPASRRRRRRRRRRTLLRSLCRHHLAAAWLVPHQPQVT